MIAAQQVSAPVDVIKKRYSVTELFGPTMQGEGIMVGRRTVFCRLHFCDGDGLGNWCSWCLVGDTAVYDRFARKHAIANIRSGQKVLAVDLKTGEIVEDTVRRMMEREVKELLCLRVKRGGKGSTRIYITNEHPLYVPKRGGWITAGELKIGDEIYNVSRGEMNSFRMKLSNPMFDASTATSVGKKTSKRTKGIPHSRLHNKHVSAAKKKFNPMRDVPGVAAKSFASQKRRPTRLEKYVIDLAQKMKLPITYTGRRVDGRHDGLFLVNDRNPDFVVKGQKKVIEVFDSSYPRKGGIKKYLSDRPKVYEAVGYKCLMLPVSLRRGHKLVDTQVSNQLLTFVRNGRKVIAIDKVDSTHRAWKRLSNGKTTVTVYNLETATHSYLAAGGLLVHNCDTKYTWDKNDPGFKNYQRLTAAEIVSRISELYGIDPEESDKPYDEPMWVTISGGNPVMQMDDELVDLIKRAGYKIQVETQGTIWKPCLMKCDKVVVSPKAPSSGLVPLEQKQVDLWLAMRQRASFKIVVFDDTDFDWADRLYTYVRKRAPSGMPTFCLQAGTATQGDVTEVLLEKYRWLVEKWLASGKMSQAIVLPQVHALVWGRKKGV